MGPIDPRLIRYVRSTRAYLAISVVLGVTSTALVLAQAYLLSSTLAEAILQRASATSLSGRLTGLALVVLARAGVAVAQEIAAHRGAARVKSELRIAVLARALELGPSWLSGQRASDLTLLTTRGIDALDGYLGRYLPQLILSATVPLAVLVAVLRVDVTAAVIIAVTIPLIPLSMIVLGVTTRRRASAQWRALGRLSGHFLDAVTGLPTLKVFGRAKAEVEEVGRTTEAYRIATLAQLRVAFLSSLVLELIAMLGIALVAGSVGLRVLHNGIGLRDALLVLLLVPEVYLPLRMVGASFHASTEGRQAAAEAFAVLAESPAPAGRRTQLPLSHDVVVEGLTVSYPGRDLPALDRLGLHAPAGRITAIVGPSGCGKSTLLAALMGYVRPAAGAMLVGGVDIADLEPELWRRQVAWLGQRPYVLPGPVGDSIRLGNPDATDSEVRVAATKAGALDLLNRAVFEGGAGLSAGERQRIALARMFLRDAPILLLDEPTAHLDATTEAAVIEALTLHARGRTVLLVAHRPALITAADEVIRLDAPLVLPDAAGAAAVA